MNTLIQTILDKIDSITTKEQLDNFIKSISAKYEQGMDANYRKNNGCYYTGYNLAYDIVCKVFSENCITCNNITSKKFLEPCVGVGNFVFAYLNKINSFDLTDNEIKQVLFNIYVSDIDNDSLTIYKMLFSKYVEIVYDYILPFDYFIDRIGHGLLFNLSEDKINYISINDVFPTIIDGFDIVITNPPYRNFKAESKHFDNEKTYEITKQQFSGIKKLVNIYCPKSNYGVLNFYRLFVEEIVTHYCAKSAAVGLLIPSTFLSDKTCAILRTSIIKSCSIKCINIIPENNPYLLAKQAVCVVILETNSQTNNIKICSNFLSQEKTYILISIKDIMNESTGNAIFALSDVEYKMYKKLQQFPKVSSIPYISNLRGELDLTTNNNSIVSKKTNYPLIRGRWISYYHIDSQSINEYISDTFINKCTKKEYIFKERIACQQVVNLQKSRRITFARVSPNNVLGNSCNFIAIKENNDDITLSFLLGILNSSTLNWYFKLLSTNNHVNNYEIDSFPIPINSPYKKQISELVEDYEINANESNLIKIDNLVNISFGLDDLSGIKDNNDENTIKQLYYRDLKFVIPQMENEDSNGLLRSNSMIQFIRSKLLDNSTKNSDNELLEIFPVVEGIVQKYKRILSNKILNHTTFKLSALDLEMAHPVPQGGNWKDIPIEIAEKSQRVMRIRQTGGRTTLYGRIDYNKPSYTITTYFNRPGNGTYIHPIHDRVLSVREAARFQSFPDSYLFLGNKTEILNQVGNAVPALLAYNIGTAIKKKIDIKTCIDLFCGAGGLSIGLKMAGIKSILGIDHDKSACLTYKVNSPETEVLCDDITLENVKRKIVNKGIIEKVDMLCGGPPCQGFSLAGKRFIDDPRNQLFKQYIEIASKIMPKIILFENVEGLLSFQKGAIYQDIIELFSSLGYDAVGKVLLASDYGVPQKRKRVIIICTRKDLNINPKDLFPIPNKQIQITAREAIGDLETIPCSENAYYLDKTNDSQYVSRLKKLI